MFNSDFYPTPPEVINQMLFGINLRGKIVLEPSAGRGDIVDALRQRGSEIILTYEKDPDLKSIVEKKSRFMGYDFLTSTAQELSHIDYIIMNPPFSRDEHHILHAWEVAPEGCEIIALCNSETTNNRYSRLRKSLYNLISNYGDETDLGDCFSDADRKTATNVSMIKLFKPVVSKEFDYDGFFLNADEENNKVNGLIRYSEIRNVVSRYVNALKCFDEFSLIKEQMDSLVKPIGLTDGFEFKFSYNQSVTSKSDFSKELQKRSWNWIFNKMNMNKFVTSGVLQDINTFVEKQSKYPFTMQNIYRMLEIIIGSRGQIMDRALVEAFDSVTKHYHGNRFHLEGWKTNSHYMINRKFILPWITEKSLNGSMRFNYSGNKSKMDDLHKALCYITGQRPTDPDRIDKDGNHEEIESLSRWAHNRELEFSTWYDWGFFEFKGFMKGTLHVKFKDDAVWEAFNRRVSEIKGYPLPENVNLN